MSRHADTIPNGMFEEKFNPTTHLLEEGDIHDITSAAKKVGLGCSVYITNNLFQHIYPYGEDATKGVTFEQLAEDMLKVFKKNKDLANGQQMEFDILTKTYVNKVYSGTEVETFKDGKARDKRFTIFVIGAPDQKFSPALLFGLKSIS